MDSQWKGIRELNGSQRHAFEEFCAQLARNEHVPEEACFIRKASPDSGVECYWKLANGEEWGWQVKYFDSPLGNSQWDQLDKSVKRALNGHPNLTRYFVCLPMDRQDPRKEESEWMMDKWGKRVKKWEDWAADLDMDVSFEYWGSSELISRLQKSENRGIAHYWFNEEVLTEAWMRNRLAERQETIGPRYTPDLHVQVPIVQTLQALCRTPEYQQRLRVLAAHGRKLLQRFRRFDGPQEFTQKAERFVSAIEEIVYHLEDVGDRPRNKMDLTILVSRAGALTESVRENYHDLQRQTSSLDSKPSSQPSDEEMASYNRDEIRNWQHCLWEARKWLDELAEHTSESTIRASNEGVLLLTGDAGTGKTHLLFDFANQRLESGQPTVALLGEEFGPGKSLKDMVNLLDLDCSHEEFLGALNAAAQAADTRGLLIIDALNETGDKTIWRTLIPQLLKRLERYPWVTLIISIRSDYLPVVLPEQDLRDRLPRVVHQGFEGVEFDALQSFCAYYDLTAPAIPPLAPEYENPLFLSLLCKGLKGQGETAIRPDVTPLSTIFSFFLDRVNQIISQPDKLDYDPSEHRVQQAVESISSHLADTGMWSLNKETAKERLHEIHPSTSWHQSLLKALISEGVLAETPFFTESDGQTEGIRFAFERMGDYFIANAHLEATPPDSHPDWPLVPDSQLGEILSGNHAMHSGIIRALSILIPEKTGRELIEYHEEFGQSRTIWEGFLDSIPWRKTGSFNETSKKLLTRNLARPELDTGPGFEALLSVALRNNHPLNADFLHSFLLSLDLPIRDAVWSTFLYESYEYMGGVRRLLDWCHEEPDPGGTVPSHEMLGLLISWLLTASTREVRDRATKALIKIWDGTPVGFNQFIDQFEECDDPYVLERLYAALYGVCLRSRDPSEITKVAKTVHATIFASGTPTPHLLLRDYCRGILDLATNVNPDLEIDPATWKPPYDVSLPDIPDEGDLPHQGHPGSEGSIEERARGHIYSSVMGFGDFARYIIGTNSESGPWQDTRLDDPPEETYEEQYEDFLEGLSSEQRELFDDYNEARKAKSVGEFLQGLHESGLTETWPDAPQSEEPGDSDSLTRDCNEKLEAFKETLDDDQLSILEDVVIPYLENPSIDNNPLDLSILQRYIYWRVFDLGWTPELHGRFDWRIDRRHNMGRGTGKPERIGKKYQWIGYDEITAYLNDTYVFEEDGVGYRGPWQLYHRDIDPSYLPHRSSEVQDSTETPVDWPPDGPTSWNPQLSEEGWLDKDDDIPPAKNVVVFEDEDGNTWLNLSGIYRWRQSIPPEREPFDDSYRDLFYILRGYIVPDDDYSSVIEWAKDQNFSGRWMPEAHNLIQVYLGEFVWADPYDYHRGDVLQFKDWVETVGAEDELPGPLHVPVDKYLWEGQYDQSIEDTVVLHTASRWMAQKMGLTWRGDESTFVNDSGVVVAFDPSSGVDNSSGLLIRKDELLGFLDEHDLRIFWIIQGEKNIIRIRREEWLGRQEISIVAELDNSGQLSEYQTTRRKRPEEE